MARPRRREDLDGVVQGRFESRALGGRHAGKLAEDRPKVTRFGSRRHDGPDATAEENQPDTVTLAEHQIGKGSSQIACVVQLGPLRPR